MLPTVLALNMSLIPSYRSAVIKVMVGGGVLSETDAIESLQYTPEELRAITGTAKTMGNRHGE